MAKLKELWGKIWFRAVSIILAIIIVIVAVLGITVACLWGNEISSVSSFTQLKARNDDNEEGSVYCLRIKGGFYFDKFLEQGGASNDSELIGFITQNITKGLMGMDIGETDIGCSSFTAVTPSGDKLFARNYDFAKTNVCITICNNPGSNRYKSFSTVDLNFVGMDTEKDVEGFMNKMTCLAAPYAPLDGINEKGLCCGIYMSYQGGTDTDGTVATDQCDPDKDDITSTTMLRMILDYAATVDEAVELVRQYNLHDSANTSFHYMIADATGKSAILEWLPAGDATDSTDNDGAARVLNVIYNNDETYEDLRDGDFQFQWITNFVVSGTYYNDYDTEAPGYDRYEHIYNRLNATNGVVADEDAAMQILMEVGRRTWAGGGGCTVHSVVYNLTQKTVLWVANENYSDKTAVYTYSFTTNKLTALA